MKWQEYQEAVGRFYEQIEGMGKVSKNITIPDRITRQPRQIDVWLDVDVKGHKIGILIDAKFRKEKLDVKDVEEVLSLADAVGANKSVIVALNGWTDPAQLKADASSLDLRLWTLEQALDIMVPDKWVMCDACNNDCIVLEYGGGFEYKHFWSLLSVGICRECKAVFVHCWACDKEILLEKGQDAFCECGHAWKNTDNGPLLQVNGDKEWISLTAEATNVDTAINKKAIEEYTQKGFYYKNQGDLVVAIRYFDKVVKLLPLSAKAYFNRGYTLDEAGLLEPAIHDYTQVIAIQPDFSMAYASRGIAYYVLGRFHQAIEDLEKYLELEPNTSSKDIIKKTISFMQRSLD